MKIKRSALIGILVVSLVALVAVGTWAWFTAQADPVVNTFTAGTVEIEINEHDFEDIANWNPGDTTEKKISVINKGSKCVYVRVALEPVWAGVMDEDGNVLTSQPDAGDNIELNIDEDDWFFNSGYYYYIHKLTDTNKETSNLLNSVKLLGDKTDNGYQGATLTITVNADAVQCSNDAVTEEWGIEVDQNGDLIEPSNGTT